MTIIEQKTSILGFGDLRMPENKQASANERQVGGDHYKKLPIEHWDLVALFEWDYFQAQITRYMMRWRNKDGIKDLEKMVHVAQKYLEVEKLRSEGKLTSEILASAHAKLHQLQVAAVAASVGDAYGDDDTPLPKRTGAYALERAQATGQGYHGPRAGYGATAPAAAPTGLPGGAPTQVPGLGGGGHLGGA